MTGAVGPVGEAAVDTAPVGIVFPDRLAGGGVEGDDVDFGGGDVHDPVDDDGGAFDGGSVSVGGILGVVCPGDFEVLDVGAVDLVEG